ncbi:zinc-dependent peptidase [Paraflavisolibacter sp. H34]|uniref:M90 family metallopeptidase n=1 Tax=Huijunlia imazamoxiresistens TaxID=3127457 RepID=UPI00301A0124
MITVLQIIFALSLVLMIILFVFRPRTRHVLSWPLNYQELLQDYVRFYANLDEKGKKIFEDKFKKFLSSVKITGAQAEVEDLDRVLVAAAAVIPVYYIPDWEYINLREVLIYPGNFNFDFEQQGYNRSVAGMVGTGALENVLIVSKWQLRQGFIHSASTQNTAIHEFVHLIDKMDGTLDGVPEILLERKYVERWRQLLERTMEEIRQGYSDIDPYGATSPVECFAVMAEYFFEQPEQFQEQHPEWSALMQRVFIRTPGR